MKYENDPKRRGGHLTGENTPPNNTDGGSLLEAPYAFS